MYGTEEVPGSYKDGKLLMSFFLISEIRLRVVTWHLLPAPICISLRSILSCAAASGSFCNYETLQDAGAQYCYREYKIAAVVSFQYMADSRRTVYPLLITSDAQPGSAQHADFACPCIHAVVQVVAHI